MIEIKDVIHLYLGCEVEVEGVPPHYKTMKWTLTGVGKLKCTISCYDISESALITAIKPILRNLGSITKEEAIELGKLLYTGVIIGNPYKENNLWRVPYGITLEDYWQIDGKVFNQHQTIYLLSKYFDILGLHEQGLCLYKSDLK